MAHINYYLKRPVEKFFLWAGKRHYRKVRKSYFDTSISGWENLPGESAIVVPNHCIGIDGMLITIAMPRPVHFLVDSGVYSRTRKSKFYGWLIGAIPVNVDRLSGNREVLNRVSDYLGYSRDFIGIFSEGRAKQYYDPDTKTIVPIKERKYDIGAAHFAIKRNVPIVPIGLGIPFEVQREIYEFGVSKAKSNFDFMKRYIENNGKIPYHINIGMPIRAEAKESKESLTQRVKTEVIRLADEIKSLQID